MHIGQVTLTAMMTTLLTAIIPVETADASANQRLMRQQQMKQQNMLRKQQNMRRMNQLNTMSRQAKHSSDERQRLKMQMLKDQREGYGVGSDVLDYEDKPYFHYWY